MRAKPTQFDDKKLSNTVATPTCSSCCCCCCCLATSVAGSVVLAQDISKEADIHQVPNKQVYVLLAALFLPISALTIYVTNSIFLAIVKSACSSDEFTSSCALSVMFIRNSMFGLLGLSALVSFLIVYFLFKKVLAENPIRKSIVFLVLFSVAFAVELFVGGSLILSTGGGGIFPYLILVPLVVLWAMKLRENKTPVASHDDFGKSEYDWKSVAASMGPVASADTPEVSSSRNLEENPINEPEVILADSKDESDTNPPTQSS